jgi:hypothetical protein
MRFLFVRAERRRPSVRAAAGRGGQDSPTESGADGDSQVDGAELKVEECNPRARALYERLGYIACGREPASWDTEAADGSLTRYETACTLMRKELP